MAFETHAGSTDLLPLPVAGESWNPHLIHTHYFGFSVPEAAIGAFIYVRYQPAFPLSQGGVCIFQGTDNVEYTDMAYLNYEITMPWPTVADNAITTDNGLTIEFTDPGRTAHLSYVAGDGRMSFDLVADSVTPLLARGHVMPGEDAHHDITREPGGSEQFMHVTGQLLLDGAEYRVDCFAPRDRSWRQIRVEKRGAGPVPPVGWSPMYFGPDLIFDQISFEPLDTDPARRGLYEVGDRPSHHFAWVQRGDETRSVTSVRRNVLEYHPRIHMATRQEISAVDDVGETYHFSGEAIAAASLPAWPNASFHDSVYRWEDESGRTAYATYQETGSTATNARCDTPTPRSLDSDVRMSSRPCPSGARWGALLCSQVKPIRSGSTGAGMLMTDATSRTEAFDRMSMPSEAGRCRWSIRKPPLRSEPRLQPSINK